NIRLDTVGSFSVVTKTYGPWFWVHTVYSYLLIGLGAWLLLRWFFQSGRLYRQQVLVLLLGALMPWLGNVLFVLRVSRLDLAPIAFTLTGLAVAWGLFRFHLMDLVPVARHTLIAGMSDGVIVLDHRGRIVDLNPAAQKILGVEPPVMIGQSIAPLLK